MTCTSPSSNLDYQDDSGEDNDHDDNDDGDYFFFANKKIDCYGLNLSLVPHGAIVTLCNFSVLASTSVWIAKPLNSTSASLPLWCAIEH